MPINAEGLRRMWSVEQKKQSKIKLSLTQTLPQLPPPLPWM